MRQNRCVLIGGSGFLGVNIARAILQADYEVIIIDKRPLPENALLGATNEIKFYQYDYSQTLEISRILQRGDILIHFAYSSLPGTPLDKIGEDVRDNTFNSVKLFELAVSKGVKKIIFPSSGGTVYGETESLPIKEDIPTNPICSYGITKLMIEKYLFLFSRIHEIDYLIYRIANAYGPGQNPQTEQGLINNAIARMLEGGAVSVFGSDELVRDYVYIEDIAEVFVLGLRDDIKNEIFNVGTGKGYSIKEILGIISKITGLDLKINYTARRLVDVHTNILDPGKIREKLGWQAKVLIEDGISKTYQWIKNEANGRL